MTLPGFDFAPRIVFCAIVAFTEKITKDGRMLSTPEGFKCPVKQLPMPVLWTPPNRGGLSRPSEPIGVIESAFVVDHRLITFGRLDGTEEVRGSVVPMLKDGSRFLEIDVDGAEMDYDLDPLMPELEQVPVGPIIFRKWRLRAAWIGDRPCWDLPRVQVEEIHV